MNRVCTIPRIKLQIPEEDFGVGDGFAFPGKAMISLRKYSVQPWLDAGSDGASWYILLTGLRLSEVLRIGILATARRAEVRGYFMTGPPAADRYLVSGSRCLHHSRSKSARFLVCEKSLPSFESVTVRVKFTSFATRLSQCE